MRVSKINASRSIMMLAVCFAAIIFAMSICVNATELPTEMILLEEEEGKDEEVRLATGAYNKESVVSLQNKEALPEDEGPDASVPEDGSDEFEITILEDEAIEEELSKAVFANVSDSVNVREEPNEDSSKVGKLFKNCSGTMLEQADGWTKISSGDLIGWVKNDYLYFGSEAERLIEENGTLKATIQADALRVRKEPNEDAGVYKLAKKGDVFTAIEELDGWVSVKVDDETTGYVSAEFATVEFSTEKGKTIEKIEEEEKAKEKAKLSQNRGAVPSSVSETALLAALIQAEAGTQPYEGQLAVGAVVMNRVRSAGYPNTVLGVITQPGQFPPATNGTVSAIAARGAKASCVQAAQAAISGQSNIGGAVHFGRVGKAAGIVIGAHVFY